MNAKKTRQKYNALPVDQRQIIAGAMVDELLWQAGSGYHEINPENIVEMVESYLDVMKEAKHETLRKVG